jgi:hypothetical protein
MDQDLEEIISRFPISQPGLLAIETNEYLCSGIFVGFLAALAPNKKK